MRTKRRSNLRFAEISTLKEATSKNVRNRAEEVDVEPIAATCFLSLFLFLSLSLEFRAITRSPLLS